MQPTPLPAVTGGDEVTQIARPSVLDESGEEESTNVEPMQTARLAAASKQNDDDDDGVDVGLSGQANAEREKALRRLTPPTPPPPPRASSDELSEFEDPDDDDDE